MTSSKQDEPSEEQHTSKKEKVLLFACKGRVRCCSKLTAHPPQQLVSKRAPLLGQVE